jgi:hypothetical protein
VPRLVVILPLLPLSAGDAFTLREWPLHVTVAPTFVIKSGLPGVLPAINPILISRRSLRLSVGPEEAFGRAQNVPVSLIEPTMEIRGLHLRLISALLAVGAQFDDPEFIGAGFRPHVTLKGASRLHSGSDLTFRQVAVVDMAPAGERRLREVVWTTKLA